MKVQAARQQTTALPLQLLLLLRPWRTLSVA
jgi:hypothetical protein